MKAAFCAITLAMGIIPFQAIARDAARASESGEIAPNGANNAALSREAERVVLGMNTFSLDLYKRMLPGSGNLFLSPASVSTAMALAYRGAIGQTAAELRGVLHYNAEPNAYFRASVDVFATMSFSGEGRTLQTANAIWMQQGLPLNADYQSDMQRFMSAGLHGADFKRDHEGSRAQINGWVANATHGHIAELLPQGVVTNKTRIILVNAMYWKGRWVSPFNATATMVEPFTTLGGNKQPTALMHQRGQFASLDRDGIQVIELPYAGGDVVMTVFLPRSSSALPEFEAGLTDKKLSRWLDDLRAAGLHDTILTLPRMHSEWEKDLKEPLSDMGAPTAFSDSADFSGIAPFRGSEPGAIGLKIDHVVHKAWLDVDEEGAEAAAATAIVGIIVTGARRGPPPPPPVIFRADRPFLYLLRDRSTGLILFVGRYVSPASVQAG